MCARARADFDRSAGVFPFDDSRAKKVARENLIDKSSRVSFRSVRQFEIKLETNLWSGMIEIKVFIARREATASISILGV